MKPKHILLHVFPISIGMVFTTAAASEFHVSVQGDDHNEGTLAKPFRTIQRAANLAQPGDVVLVHAGIYRERVNPPHGGQSDRKRIIYQAAPGERVEIRGSEVVTNWAKVQEGVWKATLPNALFGGCNPYSDLIRGDWFDPKGRAHHTGAVYLNGEWLTEAAGLDEVLKPTATNALWFAEVGATNTTLWSQFEEANPNEQLVEINVRRTVFYPDKTGINFITVRGFIMRQAATPWAPPTAEQIGLIGTHWSKCWIIESNTISHSICSGISLGKYGDAFDNTSANSAEGYVKTIERALTDGFILVPFAFAQRIFLALARAFISLRRWAAEMRRFFFPGSESAAPVPLILAQRAFAAADILALTAADLRPLRGAWRVNGVGTSPPPAMESSWLCSVSICSFRATMVLSWLVVKSVSLVMGHW